jgi:hypothetical protein
VEKMSIKNYVIQAPKFSTSLNHITKADHNNATGVIKFQRSSVFNVTWYIARNAILTCIMPKDSQNIRGTQFKNKEGLTKRLSIKPGENNNYALNTNSYMSLFVNVGSFCAQAVPKTTKRSAISLANLKQ